MVGFDSKRKMAASRHCDTETMDHLIDLRKRLAEAERQRENALDMLMLLRREHEKLMQKISELSGNK